MSQITLFESTYDISLLI